MFRGVIQNSVKNMYFDALAKTSACSTPFERGVVLGTMQKDSIHAHLSSIYDHFSRGEKLASLKRKISCFLTPYIKLATENELNSIDEVKGLAKGANISLRDAFLLQYKREALSILSSPQPSPILPECSVFSSLIDSHESMLAQTIDLGTDTHFSFSCIVREKLNKNTVLQYSQPGQLGYLGMSSAGICICISVVSLQFWQPGVSISLIVRALLDMSDLDECVSFIKKIKRSSARALTLMQNNTTLHVEFTTTEVRIVKEQYPVHTNHFLHSDFQKYNPSYNRFMTYSRKDYIKHHISCKKGLTIKCIKKILQAHQPESLICFHKDQLGFVYTAAAVIMLPLAGVMKVVMGYPCQEKFETYSL